MSANFPVNGSTSSAITAAPRAGASSINTPQAGGLRELEGLVGGLTAREHEVAALIALGLSNREIGEVLIITVRTVETHVTHILNKLGVRSRTQVAVLATERGIGSARHLRG